MRRTRFAIAVLAIAAALGQSAAGRAEDPEAKRELALELLRIAGGGKMAEQISKMLLSAMRTNYASMIEQLIASQPSLTPEEELKIRQHLGDYDRFATKFSTRLMNRIDFDQVLEQVYVPLYEEHFTEEELHQILEFQRSPAGRKAASVMPQLLQQGLAATLSILQPIVTTVVAEVLAEEQVLALGQ